MRSVLFFLFSLLGFKMIDWFYTQFGFSIVLMVVFFGGILSAAGFCTLLERKVAAWLQDRIGPNRAGPGGLLQPLADGMKFMVKEEIVPAGADRPVFILAPMLALGVALLGFAVIPWGGLYQPPGGGEMLKVQVASVDIGLLYVLAVGAMGVYGVVLGSWASNNKYSFYGGMRAAAQMLSYEVPMGLAILVVVLTVGELRLENIVTAQTGLWWGWLPQWNIFLHPVTFIVLFTTALAETNRAPFDLAECEQELVGGFHTEYSSMKWAMFFLGEYSHMITASAFITVLFLGGWHLPGIGVVQGSLWGVLLQMFVMFAKIGGCIFVFMWIRWTLPRFRFDQVMRLCWIGLVPLMLCQVMMACVVLYRGGQQTVWALVGELGVVVLFGIVFSFRTSAISGRQRHLMPVRQSSRRASLVEPV